MRTTIEFSDVLLRQAKREAQHRGQTLRELVNGAVARDLKQTRRQPCGPCVIPQISVPKDAPILRLSPQELKRIDAETP